MSSDTFFSRLLLNQGLPDRDQGSANQLQGFDPDAKLAQYGNAVWQKVCLIHGRKKMS